MTTNPGFSSRSTSTRVTQLPQRDEAIMSDYQPEPGFSNSEAVEDSGVTGTIKSSADAEQANSVEPGFSNGKEAKTETETSEQDDQPAKKAAPAKKTAKKKP